MAGSVIATKGKIVDLFGVKEHDQRHDEVECQLRRLIEQVAQLTINTGVTRAELRALRTEVEGKVSASEVDPALIALNEGIKTARTKLAAAEEATDEYWASVNQELKQAIDELREALD